jgi:WhiB family redox-sensing transcriptional regulator
LYVYRGSREAGTNVTIIESRPAGSIPASGARAVGGLQTDWAGQGRCVNNDPDALFVRGAAQQNAKVVCQKCPVIAECLATRSTTGPSSASGAA